MQSVDKVLIIVTFLFYAVRTGIPLLLATTGEILHEKSGSLNLGIEGIMAVGAVIGYLGACKADSLFVGLIVAFLASGACGLIYAFLTVTMRANQNVTGLALTIFGLGVYQFVGQSLRASGKFPLLARSPGLVSSITDKGIPLLRDIPYVGKLLFSYNIFVYLSAIIALACWIYIKYTRTGLRMRAVGESPNAADGVGISVDSVRYANIIIGSGICGIGGLYLALLINGGEWNTSWINGFGWIAIALVIFASWSPAKAIGGSFLFGLFYTLQAWKGSLASVFPEVLGWMNAVPNDFYQMLPFLITALVLIFSSITKKKTGQQPAAIGINYFREDR
ncbi:MAG TPA: ABC transporter permease [Clostridia bacterium]|nr:ABC transporter permease [Clostridia bacterium]